MSRILAASLLMLFATAARAAETMEAIGAQRCGGSAPSLTVEFLAPETAMLIADAKVIDAAGRESRTPPNLSLDGRACSGGQCDFRARKGQTYTLAATRQPRSPGKLCISVVRP